MSLLTRSIDMLDKDIIAENKSGLTRDQVRKVLIEAWLGRSDQERNQFAAERFIQQAARDFEFESERPRPIVIRGWILPHVVRVKEKRETGLGRWLNRPWFKRTLWPYRIALGALLGYVVYRIFMSLFRGTRWEAIQLLPIAALIVVVMAAFWFQRKSDI